jgi:hypothetical protein
MIDDRLDLPASPPPSKCPEADQLRALGMLMMRHYYKVAKMTETAYARDVEGMLASLRDARTMFLDYADLENNQNDIELLGEFNATERKIVAFLEQRRAAS